MMQPDHPETRPKDTASVIEPNYFSNCGDLWYPRWANMLLGLASRMSWLTPNGVTITSFVLYIAAACLIGRGGEGAMLAVVLLPLSYVLDCLDGQLARFTGQSSVIGDYLDKTLDVLKIGVINAGFALAAYRTSGEVIYVFLGMFSCFGFLFRYYIKLETMFSAINHDPAYLDKSRKHRHALYAALAIQSRADKSLKEHLQWLWLRHHSVLALDEAEHVTFGAVAIAFGRPDLWLWLFGIGQMLIALVRLVQRGRQIIAQDGSLTYPMRK
ncbi:MAG: CDP-alcohol phosphatidyltransferase family protein [Hyphomicrobiales bacterium]|nr:CDP-alcohol phosphatidyltransferase family protein [Hyphomicrobiales bacterium]